MPRPATEDLVWLTTGSAEWGPQRRKVVRGVTKLIYGTYGLPATGPKSEPEVRNAKGHFLHQIFQKNQVQPRGQRLQRRHPCPFGPRCCAPPASTKACWWATISPADFCANASGSGGWRLCPLPYQPIDVAFSPSLKPVRKLRVEDTFDLHKAAH